METSTISDVPKQKISKFVIFWIALIVLCLLIFVVSMGLMGWGFYTVIQQANGKSKIPSATATAAAQWPVVFRDDFGKVSEHWFTGDYAENGYHDMRSISNGVYTWALENASGYTFWNPAGAGIFKDFALSVDVRHTSGTLYDEYGLIFCNVASNYYMFSIQDSGAYSVAAWSADKWNQIIPLSRTNTIKPGEFNHLTVLAETGMFKLFINNEFVGEFQDSTLPSGEVGLMLNPRDEPAPINPKPNGISKTFDKSVSTVGFDNFEVRAPKGSVSDLFQPFQLPQIEPEKGILVFASNRDGNRNIYTIFTNGSGVKQLTDSPTDDYAPRWSPDGKQIVFVSNRDGNPEIYVMDAAGKNLTRLTNKLADDISPDWSLDGKQIIFSSNRNGNYDLYLMSAQGEKTNISQLTDTKFDEINPSISPDGKQILFQENENIDYKLYIMGIDGKQRKPLTDSNDAITYSDGAWAPDSIQFAYVRKYLRARDILIGDVKQTPDSFAGYQITQDQGMNLYPNWSPSGKQIVFVSEVGGQSDIYIILANGNGIFRVTHNEAVEESPDWTVP